MRPVRAIVPRTVRGAGFSIVELLVSVVIGLLALMFATRMVANTEQAKQGALGSSDSMQNGMAALFSISHDAAQAGWGLNDPMIAGCDTIFSDSGAFALATASRAGASVTPLAAAVIESNGTAPDRISLYSGTSMAGTGNLRLTQNYSAGGSSLAVDRVPYGFARGDVIVVVPETVGASRCSLAQVAADPGAQSLNIGAGSGLRFNSGSGLGASYSSGQARLFNLGPASRLAFHTWSVENGYLMLRAIDLDGAGGATPVVDNVVSIKAQYGFGSGVFSADNGVQVNRWSNRMIDADGDGVEGSAGDYLQVTALRLAVVARSRNPDKPNADGNCVATPTALTVFGSAEPAGVTAQPVPLDLSNDNDDIDWKCYRYRVFETIVPIRNAGWRPT